MYDHYFINFGRPPIPNDLCKDSATRHPLFWRRFLKVFTIYGHGCHLGQRRATILAIFHSSWSMDSNHFSSLSFPCPREAPYEIWATLAQRFQKRSHLKFSTFFPYKCIRKQTWPYRKKGQISMYNHYFTNFLSPMIYAKIQAQGIQGSGEEDF